MTKYLVIPLSLAAIFFAACSKKATPSADTYKDWLRNSKWKIASGTLTLKKPNGTDTILNYLNWIPACHQHDYFSFNTATTGAFYNGTKCDPSQPDSISFTYQLTNDNKYLSLYCSDHLYYAVTETILPWVIDTLVYPPNPVVLDTLHGVNDTAAGYTRTVVVMDTIWRLNFNTAPVVNVNISNAPITNFTSSSFTLDFYLISPQAYYPDSTNYHTGMYIYPDLTTGNPDTLDFNPIIRADTFKYHVNYTTH